MDHLLLKKTHVASTGIVHQCKHFPAKNIQLVSIYELLFCKHQPNHPLHWFPWKMVKSSPKPRKWANDPSRTSRYWRPWISNCPAPWKHMGGQLEDEDCILGPALHTVEREGQCGSFLKNWIDLPTVTGFGQPTKDICNKQMYFPSALNRKRLTGWRKSQAHTKPNWSMK